MKHDANEFSLRRFEISFRHSRINYKTLFFDANSFHYSLFTLLLRWSELNLFRHIIRRSRLHAFSDDTLCRFRRSFRDALPVELLNNDTICSLRICRMQKSSWWDDLYKLMLYIQYSRKKNHASFSNHSWIISAILLTSVVRNIDYFQVYKQL